MAWPPPVLSTTRTDTTVMASTHPQDHNAVNLAINDIVATLPRGRVAWIVDTGAVSTSAGAETVFVACPAFNAPGGRRYRIVHEFTGLASVNGDLYRFTVRRGATTAGTAVKVGPAWSAIGAGGYGPFVIVAYDTPPATASMQYMVGVARMSGTGLFQQQAGATYGNSMYVEDIGAA